MFLLALASLLFAFSFGLIRARLGGVDPTFVAFARVLIALLVFLPFLRLSATAAGERLRLMSIGAVQFGLMYLLYQRAYDHLQGHEVALFTVLTPLHVVLLDGALARRLRARDLVAALLAVVGAACLAWRRPDAAAFGAGFLLVQAANLCFAAGQVFYRRHMGAKAPHAAAFGWLYLGATLVTGAAMLASTDLGGIELDASQGWVLLYLGAVPSGLAFFLWNVGATRVNAGVLAAFNNLKVPLAVPVALLVFDEPADLPRLAASAVLIAAALGVATRRERAG